MKVCLGVLGLDISLRVCFAALLYQSPEPGQKFWALFARTFALPTNGYCEEQDSVVGASKTPIWITRDKTTPTGVNFLLHFLPFPAASCQI